MSISSELLTLQNTKTAIRTAINNKGGSVGASDTFASYATAIDNLPSGGSGNPILTSIDVSDFTGTTFNQVAKYITDVTIPSGVTSIGQSAFQDCSILTSISIPNSVTSIGASAFQGCTSLTSLHFPSSVTILPYAVCSGCRSLTTVELPSNMTAFYNQTFEYCTSLASITIPNTVTSIGTGSFYGCSGLTYIVCLPTTPPTLANSNVFVNTNNCPIYVPASSVDTYKAASNWSDYASRIYPIQQVATVDGNPVYNYELGNTNSTTILSTEIVKMPTGTSIEFAEGITNMGGSISGYTTVTLPSTFATFNDQNMIGSSVTTLTMKSTTPPTAERNNLGGAGLTAIYVPASAVDTYKAASGWSNFASIIEGISSPSITITEYEDQSVVDNAIDLGEFFGYDGDEVVVDSFAAASSSSTFDSDLKAANIIVVEDDNGNDITSQCTFTSPDFSRWDSTQDPSWDGESPATYEWQAGDTIASGDSQTPGSVSITATYGRLTDTLSLEYSKTDETPEPEPEPDPEEPEE